MKKVQSAAATPVPSSPGSGRIDSLDLIRGVAILCILFMNIMSMTAPPIAYFVPEWSTAAGVGDRLVYIIQSLFVESRFMSLFSLLFGVGLAIQTDGMVAREVAPRPWIRRRLAWLLLFGLVHGLLVWAGDILTLYAITGLFAWRGARWSVKRLVVVGTVFLLLGQLALLSAFAGSVMTGENLMEIPSLPYTVQAVRELRTQWTGFVSRIPANAGEYLEFLLAIPLTLFWHTGGVMLLGIALYRRGFFTDTTSWKWTVPAGTVGLLGATAVLLLRYRVGVATSASYATMSMMMIPGLLMALAYASFLVRIASKETAIIRILRDAGKTAFTLYIAQSIVIVGIFTVIAPELWGRLGRPILWLIVIVFSCAQALWAHHHQKTRGRGPLERLWRYLAYRRRPDEVIRK
ncbi:MAG: DUF418 domain-containing protein [Alkalispirochaeta sp.]